MSWLSFFYLHVAIEFVSGTSIWCSVVILNPEVSWQTLLEFCKHEFCIIIISSPCLLTNSSNAHPSPLEWPLVFYNYCYRILIGVYIETSGQFIISFLATSKTPNWEWFDRKCLFKSWSIMHVFLSSLPISDSFGYLRYPMSREQQILANSCSGHSQLRVHGFPLSSLYYINYNSTAFGLCLM